MEDFIYYHPIITFIIAIFLLLGLSLTPAYFISKKICEDTSKKMGINCEYDIWIGCMVEIGGKWQPFNEYNTINIQN